MNSLHIVIPLYRAPDLIRDLIANLRSVSDEIRARGARVVFFNDSPGHSGLKDQLEIHLLSQPQGFEYELVENVENIGFVKTVNLALSHARGTDADVLLLNSDALFTAGVITELGEVAYLDPLISVVSPRSNNATICNSPYAEGFRAYDFDDAFRAHRIMMPHLERMTYVPTAVGFCLYIKNKVIKEFGFFDEIYGAGYNEENDFIMRCNRKGYRSVLANHAFVYHLGNISFDMSGEGKSPRERRNREILDARYPEYERAIARYFGGTEYKAQYLCSGLVPDLNGKININFDCRNIGDYFNGTFEHAIALLEKFTENYHKNYNIFISCNQAAYKFHHLYRIKNASFIIDNQKISVVFAVTFRIGQPFDWRNMVAASSSAPVTGYLMLDTIALDCFRLDTDGLESIWNSMLQMNNLIGFNSKFSRDQFFCRFIRPAHLTDFVSLCSTDTRDYQIQSRSLAENKVVNYVLVVGNEFPHKNIDAAIDAFRKRADRPKVIVLGSGISNSDDIIGYKSGGISQDRIDELYANASVLVFPSHYEGFGLPIMRALAANVPVVARNLPVFEEIRRESGHEQNIHLFETMEEMVSFALSRPLWCPVRDRGDQVKNWATAADDLERAISQAISSFDAASFRLQLRAKEICQQWLHELDAKNALVHEKALAAAARNRTASGRDEASPASNLRGVTGHRTKNPDKLRNDDVWRQMKNGKTIDGLADDVIRYDSDVDARPEELLVHVSELGKAKRSHTYSFVKVAGRLKNIKSKQAALDILRVSDLLSIGGEARISLKVRQIVGFGKRNPDDCTEVRIQCANAGLDAYYISHLGGYLDVSVVKVSSWSDGLHFDSKNETFMQSLYIRAFGRDLDVEASVWLDALKEGADQYDVALRVFASRERWLYLAREQQPGTAHAVR